MCPVEWHAPHRRFRKLQFLSVPPRRAIVMLQTPDQLIGLALHWSDTQRQSMLCAGRDCTLCGEYPKKVHVYTVCLVWDRAIKQWIKTILDCGHPGGRLCNDNFAGEKIIIDRISKDQHKGFIEYCGQLVGDGFAAIPDVTQEDVRPYLMARYGLYDEADYFRSLPLIEQGRLPFPGARGEERGAG